MGKIAATKINWQPMETAPWNETVLVSGESGYANPDTFICNAYRIPDWHRGAWNDATGTPLEDRGWEPTAWAPQPIVKKEEGVRQTYPLEYSPGTLDWDGGEKEEEPPMYAIGYKTSPGNYGMMHGPVLNVYDMLNIIPDHATAYIFLLSSKGAMKVLYRWHRGRQAWVWKKDGDIHD